MIEILPGLWPHGHVKISQCKLETLLPHTWSHELEGQFAADLGTQVIRNTLHTGPGPSTLTSSRQDRRHKITTWTQPKATGSVSWYILLIQLSLRTGHNKSQEKKQRPEGTGRHKLGTTERNTTGTDDLQGTREIYSQLCGTCLEHKCKHKQYWNDTESAEWGTGDHHRSTQDVQHWSSSLQNWNAPRGRTPQPTIC